VGEESGWKKIHTVCLSNLNVRNADGVWRSIYLGDASLARSIFNERVYPSVFALHRAKCTRGN
jgi:hypothetical protein